MTIMQAHIAIQKLDLGEGGMPSNLERTAAIKAFTELDARVGSMRPEEKMPLIKHSQRLGFSRAEWRQSCSRKPMKSLERMGQ